MTKILFVKTTEKIQKFEKLFFLGGEKMKPQKHEVLYKFFPMGGKN